MFVLHERFSSLLLHQRHLLFGEGRIEVMKVYRLSSPPSSHSLKEYVRRSTLSNSLSTYYTPTQTFTQVSSSFFSLVLVLPFRSRNLLQCYILELQQALSPLWSRSITTTQRKRSMTTIVSLPFLPPRGLGAVLPLSMSFVRV